MLCKFIAYLLFTFLSLYPFTSFALTFLFVELH